MKKMLLVASAIMFTLSSFAQTWKIDPSHSKIRFSVKYLVISDVSGEFKKFDGTFTATKADWTDMQGTVTTEVSSISTDDDMRDKHLQGDAFFAADKYPTASFKIKNVKSLGGNKLVFTGDLTIRDVTKTVDLPVVYGGSITDPWGNLKAGFKAMGSINRKEFGIKYNDAAKTGEAVVSDNVDFIIDLVLVKQK